jgi:hypothetical protein
VETTPITDAICSIAEYALASGKPEVMRQALDDIVSCGRYGFNTLSDDDLKKYGIEDSDD